MRGIILAGGLGSRLFPLTLVASKQLQPVYDKPMVYYPLTTLIENRVWELCLITSPQDRQRFESLLGDGSRWGISIEYREQAHPGGIAEALLIAETFTRGEPAALILGDNIFSGAGEIRQSFSEFRSGATVFGCLVHDPKRYGVIEVDARGVPVSIEEKPAQPKSEYAVPGLYLLDGQASAIARTLKRSPRGELEITDLLRAYLEGGTLTVRRLSRGIAWLDAGTSSSLHDASAYVQTIEKRQGIKLGCPEEAAYRNGRLTLDQLKRLVSAMPQCEYRDYLERVSDEPPGR